MGNLSNSALAYTMSNQILSAPALKQITRAPPRLPRLEADQRTLRQPPLPGITSPAIGLTDIQLMNVLHSVWVQMSAA